MSTACSAKLKEELSTPEGNLSFVYSRHCISHKLRYFMSRTLTSILRNSARLPFTNIYHSRFVLLLLDQHPVLLSFSANLGWLIFGRNPKPAAGPCPWV